MTITKTIKIDVDADQATKDVDKFNDEIEETNESTNELGGSLDTMTGGAIAGFGKMLGSIKKTIMGFKSLKVAIAATGIGLLIIAIGSVATAFKASEEGQNKFTKLMGQIGVVTGNVIDIFANLGESILAAGKALVRLAKGDLKGASAAWGEFKDNINEVTDGVKNFASETEKEFAVAADIADKRAEASRLQRKLIIDIAEAERDVIVLRDKAARKDLFNAQERKAALEEAAAINDRIIDQQIEAARLTAEAIAAENELSKSTIEDKEAQAQAEAELIRLETVRFTRRKQLGAALSAINQQEAAEKQALIDADKKRIADEEKAASEKDKRDLEAHKKGLADKKKADDKAAAEKKAADEKAADEASKLAEAESSANIGFATQTSNLVGQIVGEDSKAAKGVAIASATISGIESVQNAFTTAQKSPITAINPAYPFIQAGIAGAFSLLQLAKIKKSDPTGKSSSGGGSTGGGGGAAPAFNLVAGTGTNQITEGLKNDVAPVKAFVVSSDVSTSQELDRKIVEGASL